MGNVNKGCSYFCLQRFQLHFHLVPELEVQSPQRLVQQKNGGIQHQTPGDGHPLFLTAGEFIDIFIFKPCQIHPIQDGPNLLLDFLFVLATPPQAEGDVFSNVHHGEQRQVLENQIDRPLVGGNAQHAFPANFDDAPGGLLQTGDHAQQGGFTAAGRAEDGKKLPVYDVKGYGIDGRERTELFCDILNG